MCLSPPVSRWLGRLYWGLVGMMSAVEASLAAFVGGVEQALLHFIGEELEFTWVWDRLKREAMESSKCLDRELRGPLIHEVVGAGEVGTDGSTGRVEEYIVGAFKGTKVEVFVNGEDCAITSADKSEECRWKGSLWDNVHLQDCWSHGRGGGELVHHCLNC